MTRSAAKIGLFFFLLFSCLSLFCATVTAQTVQPVLAEYTGVGKGTFVVSNSSYTSVAVLLEPQSFSIDTDGNGIYRPLDPGVHMELSKTSLRLGPRESETIFYKVNADRLPAWLTIYATFAPVHASPGVNVHIMLPHTIYLYSKEQIKRKDVTIGEVKYDMELHEIIGQLTNVGPAAGRVDKVEVYAGHSHATAVGFPLLPGATRRFSIPWTDPGLPQILAVNFNGFTVKQPIPVSAMQ